MSKKILIVDDDEDIIIFLETLLSKAGYETSTAMNGEEAVKLVKQEKPDLITLDLQMPKNTGTDFYRNIRRDKTLKDVPVIVISGIPGKHLSIPRPAAVFDKPIDKEELLEAVEGLIG
ncbi:MAG TPA: response regulator [Bacteroidetes bacterium]|nr:response regulator [Bacteroidota bacterium]